MYGTNVPRRREHSDHLQLQSVFYTIQGEGPFAGSNSVFVRLTGCNLKCWFCDTQWNDETDPYVHYDQIAKEARDNAPPHCRLAVITGGEPMRQDLAGLIGALQAQGFRNVQIETAGSFWQDCVLWDGITTVISPKTAKVHKWFHEHDNEKFFWKYVIKAAHISDGDGLPSESMQRVGNGIGGGTPARPSMQAISAGRVFVQPMDEGSHRKNVFNTRAVGEVALKFGYKACLQMHKYLEVE